MISGFFLYKDSMKKTLKLLLLSLILFFIFPIKAYCKPVVVVIDPGHGGEALGGNMDDRIEKEINLITANAMRDRLSLYDNVEVYLTRENNEDPDPDRKARMKVAKDHNADMLFSIHYNMSENHTLYGTECWTPMTGNIYAQTMECATIINKDLADLGLFNRGVKHRSAKDGSEYYGILKYSVDYGIPALIIEHCHLDEERDAEFWNNDAYVQFGITDADAVAKYFRLASLELGVDYSDYERETFEVPSSPVREDTTEPEECNIELIDADTENGYANILLSASDSDGYIQYYSYSLNNGGTFERLESWPGKDEASVQVTVPLKVGEETNLLFSVQNQYDMYTLSNMLTLPAADEPIVEVKEADEADEVKTIEQELTFEPKKEEKDIVMIIATIVTLVIVILFTIVIVIKISDSRRRRRRKKKKKKRR